MCIRELGMGLKIMKELVFLEYCHHPKTDKMFDDQIFNFFSPINNFESFKKCVSNVNSSINAYAEKMDANSRTCTYSS